MKGPGALMSCWSDPELQADIGYQLLKRNMGYLLLLCTEKKVLYFHHSRQLVRMFLIKQALHEWVTVISAEEDTYTWWGWSVVLAFVTWSVFASGAGCTKSPCVLSSSQWRQQSGKSVDYEEPDPGRCTHERVRAHARTQAHTHTHWHTHASLTPFM